MSDEGIALCDRVARRVMGWRQARIPWAYSASVVCWHNPDGVPVMARDAWRPDEDDRQCMRVLDRMTALGFDCSLTLGSGAARAAFGRGDEPAPASSHPDRRMALLLAALAASGGSVDGADGADGVGEPPGSGGSGISDGPD